MVAVLREVVAPGVLLVVEVPGEVLEVLRVVEDPVGVPLEGVVPGVLRVVALPLLLLVVGVVLVVGALVLVVVCTLRIHLLP